MLIMLIKDDILFWEEKISEFSESLFSEFLFFIYLNDFEEGKEGTNIKIYEYTVANYPAALY